METLTNYVEVELPIINPANVGNAVTSYLAKRENIEAFINEENACLQVYVMFLDTDDDSGKIAIELVSL